MFNTCKLKFSDIEKIGIYVNTDKKTMAEIKKEIDCDYIINGGLYNMSTFTPQGTLIVDRQELSYQSGVYGFRFDGNTPTFAYYDNDYHRGKCENFITTKPVLIRNSLKTYDTGGLDNSNRGRSAIGVTADNELVLFCMQDSIGSDDLTFDELSDEMLKLGCVTACNLDGGGSSQANFDGVITYSSRIVHNFIYVKMKKKEGEPLNVYKVAIDVGHVANTANESPDGSYNEHEGMLDIAQKMQSILSKYPEVESKIFDEGDMENDIEELYLAVKNINAWGSDIAVSLHSNANANYSANGWDIHIYSKNSSAEELAEFIHNESVPYLGLTDRGVTVSSALYFLKATSMPAVLIEHGFHTNENDTDKLKDENFRLKCAVANCKGILNYFGIEWIEETSEHWAQVYLDDLVEAGVISSGDAWSDFDASLETKTIGELLALVSKARKG